jgi:hypothetical protein
MIYQRITTLDHDSGAPILKYYGEGRWCLVGVHVGRVLGKVESGAVLTKSLKRWIMQSLDLLDEKEDVSDMFGKKIVVHFDKKLEEAEQSSRE